MTGLRSFCVRTGPWVYAGLFSIFCLAFYLPLSSKAINNIFYIGLALPGLIWLLCKPRALKYLGRPFGWMFVLLVLMVWVDASHAAGMKKALYLLLLFVSCLLLEGYDRVRSLVTIFALVSVGILLFVAADWWWLWTQTGGWVRYGSFLGAPINPVYFSLLITSALVFLWLFHVEVWLERRSRLALLSGLFLLTVAVLLCSSIFQARSALLGFAAFFAGYLICKRMILPGLLLVLFLGLGLFVLGGHELLLERGTSYRPLIWQDAWSRLTGVCNVWLGCGADGYLFLGQFQHPHSGYMAMLYRNGVLGAALFILFGLAFVWQGIRSRWMLLALVGWGSLLTTTSGVLTSPQPLWIYFWLPTFMAILDGKRSALGAYYAARQPATQAAR